MFEKKFRKKGNTYSDSEGNRWTQGQIDLKIRQAKSFLIDKWTSEDMLFCSICKRYDCIPITCMHVVSVDKAKKMGKVELCWDLENIKPAGLNCHQINDGLKVML